ncbi:MAG: glutamine synthetase family protein [Parvularculaceae bacterium]
MTSGRENSVLMAVEEFLRANPSLEQLDLMGTDLAGNFFGKRYPIERLREFATTGLTLPRAMYVLGTTGRSMYEHTHMGKDDGDPDFKVAIAPKTLAVANWGDRPRAQAIVTGAAEDIPVDPRRVLARVLDRWRAIGLNPVVAFELEFFLFEFDRAEDGGVIPARNPKTGQTDIPMMLNMERLGDFETVLDDIARECESQGIKTTTLGAEYGSGQFEINFHHYDDAMLAADHAQMFKRLVKAVARNHGLRASFMAKPDIEEPGSGQHLHISVLDKAGKNIFDGGDKPTPALMHAMGGLVRNAPEAMIYWAPNVNSYRRFSVENCVPTGATWSFENRFVGFRIPLATNGAWRIENRIPGADALCYLTLASTLAAMLHGIENQTDPGPETKGAPDLKPDSMPLEVRDAIAKARSGAAIRNYLGDDFVDLYCKFRKGDLAYFEEAITPREIDWFL